MAPEATVPGGTVDRRADVYAMGVVLYETLTLQLPPNTPRTVKEAQAPREPYVAEPNLPGPINAILARAMAEDPARRFQDARQMSEALEGFLVSTRQSVTPQDISEFLEAVFGDEARAGVVLEAGATSTAVLPGGTAPLSMPQLSPVSLPSRGSLPPVPSAPTRRQVVLPVLVGAATALLVGFLVLLAVWPRTPGGTTDDIPLVAAGPRDEQFPEIEIPVEVEAALDPAPPEAAEPPPAVHPGPPGVRRPSVRRAPRPGRVTIRVNPWAEVSYGGKVLGTTPLPPVEVPSGTAVFTLKNSQLGVTRRVSVKVPPGGSVVLKADLFSK
jgi:serine/threonine-protein kinase